MCYTEAYASFAAKCIVAPHLPNNQGTLALVEVSAPDDCILNAKRPAPVAARHITGQMLPDVVFGCLDQAIPGRVPAEGTSCLWNLSLSGGKGRVETSASVSDDAIAFEILSFHSGGTGGRPGNDGLSATAFPSGVRTVPAEITELMAPVVIWRKELREDSGGPGEFRGGLGQVMEVGTLDKSAFAISASFDRIENPPRGRRGGVAGSSGKVGLTSGRKLRGKGVQTVAPTDRVVLRMPGGGGLGDPHRRPASSVQHDVRMGLVSRASAAKHYGVALDALGAIDEEQTHQLRRTQVTNPQ
jgi:N-methylhydantoinase B